MWKIRSTTDSLKNSHHNLLVDIVSRGGILTPALLQHIVESPSNVAGATCGDAPVSSANPHTQNPSMSKSEPLAPTKQPTQAKIAIRPINGQLLI